MISENDHVVRKGEPHPVGIVEGLNETKVTVRWGYQDGKKFVEDIPEDELELWEPLPLHKPFIKHNIFKNK